MVVAVHLFTMAAAQKQAARDAVLEQLREAGATGRSTPTRLKLDSEEAETALGELIESGDVIPNDSERYYISEAAKPAANPGSSLVLLLLGLLIMLSIAASLIALLAF